MVWLWPFYTRISRKDFSMLLHVNKIHMFHVLLFWYWKWRFCEKKLSQNCNKAIHHCWTYWNNNNNSERERSQINSGNQSKLFMTMENSILILITNNILFSIRLRINFKSIFSEIAIHWALATNISLNNRTIWAI